MSGKRGGGRDRHGVDEELALHLEAVADDLVAGGWAPDEAAAEARRRFGDYEATRRYCRRMDARWAKRERRRTTMEGWALDLRFALRQWRRAPVFTLVTAATLALGVGAVTGIAAVVEAVLLRPLPYPEPERLVRIWDTSTRLEGWDRVDVNPANFRDWQEAATSFTGLGGFAPEELTLRTADGAERVPGVWVTAGLLDVLGTPPILGRGPLPEEDVPGAEAPVVVLGHGAWSTRHGSDPDVLGTTVRLGGRSVQVIGVAPPDLRLPGLPVARQPDYLLPGGFGEPNGRGGHWLRGVGRLGPGVTLGAAQAEMSGIAAALEAEYPESNDGLGVRLERLHEAEVGGSRTALVMIAGAVGLLLLIACANVAGLFLVRHIRRRREFAVRASLGAGRARVLRQLVVETVALGALGAGGGIALASLIVGALPRLAGVDLPRVEEVGLPGAVLATAVLAGLASAALAVLVPALVAIGRDPATGLSGDRGVGRRARRGADLLAAVQVMLSTVLLAGAGVLAHSYLRLSAVDPGFESEGAAVVRIVVPETTYDDRARAALYESILDEVRAIPGVTAAGAGDSPPLQRAQNSRTSYRPEDRPAPGPGEAPLMAWEEYATPGYFEALGIPLLEGRGFTRADDGDAPPVAVVSRAFAETTWPGRPAVGERFLYNGRSWEIVGVVGSTRRRGLDDQPGPEMFFPPGQQPWWVPSAVFIVVRTAGDPRVAVASVRAVVARVASDVPVGLAATMESLVDTSLAPARFRWTLVGAFGAAALALALLGVYGVLAYAVALRRRELGIRMALGAEPASLRWMVLGRGLAVTGAGVAAGLGIWAVVGRVAEGFLFGVGPFDPLVLAFTATLFLAAGALAAWRPARSATRVDPMTPLRDHG